MRLRFLRDARFDYGTADGVRSSLYVEGAVADVPPHEAAVFLSHGAAEVVAEEKAVSAPAERATKARSPRTRKEN